MDGSYHKKTTVSMKYIYSIKVYLKNQDVLNYCLFEKCQLFGITLLHIQDGSEEMGDIISHSTGKHLPHTANFYYRWLFFRKCDVFFKSPKKIFQKTSLNLKSKFPANNSKVLLAGNLNFKLRIDFWNFFFEIWRSEKRIALSEKKPPLVC